VSKEFDRKRSPSKGCVPSLATRISHATNILREHLAPLPKRQNACFLPRRKLKAEIAARLKDD
jgi:hypothetical protein